MAQPIKYIPTDFSATSNVLGQFRQDMALRDQRFDQGVAMQNQALGQLYGIQTSNPEERNAIVADVEARLDEAVEKRGGDYGAAAKDISRIVATEAQNPWYAINAERNEALAMQRKLAQNADNLILGDANISAEEWAAQRAQGIDPGQVTALSKSDVYTRAKDIASNYATLLLTDPEFSLNSALGGQYWTKVSQHGFDDQSINEFIESGEGSKIMDSMLESYPQLQGANETQLREVMKQGLRSAIGKTDARELSNQAFLTERDKAYIAGQKGGASPMIGYAGQEYLNGSNTILNNSPSLNRRIAEMAKKEGWDDVTNYQELVEKSTNVKKTKKEINKAFDDYLTDNPSEKAVYDKAVGRQRDIMKGEILNKVLDPIAEPESKRAKQLLDEITLETDKGIKIPKFNFKPRSGSTSDISTFNNNKKQLIELLTDQYNMELLKPVNDDDADVLEEIQELEKEKKGSSQLSVRSFAYDPTNVTYTNAQGEQESIEGYGSGLVLEVKGKDKKGETISARLLVPKDDITSEVFEVDVMRILTSLSPEMAYIYANDTNE